MARSSEWVRAYRSLGVVVFAVAAIAAAVISSCGGGGSGSSGELCSQCGDTDGPCIPTVEYTPDPSLPPPCDAQPVPTCSPVPATTSSVCAPGTPQPLCTVHLICRRKSDSSQQRCFPADPTRPANSPEVNFQWRCDGSRPGGTAVPAPTGTESVTPSTAATPTTCGNGVVDSGEQCDGNNNGRTCESFGCTTPLNGSGVTCNSNCTFNVTGCLGSCVVL